MIYKKDNIIARKIHDTFFLIDITQNYLEDKCILFQINEVGYWLWNTMTSISNVNELVESLYEKLDKKIDKNILTEDIRRFLDLLAEEGCIEEDGRNK